MRTTKNISITMPMAMVKEAERLAKRENRTMSELVREALRHYKSRRIEEQRDLSWVNRLVREAKREQKEQPMTPVQLLAEDSSLTRAEAEYARPDLTEDDVVRIIHEYRAKRRA